MNKDDTRMQGELTINPPDAIGTVTLECEVEDAAGNRSWGKAEIPVRSIRALGDEIWIFPCVKRIEIDIDHDAGVEFKP